MLPRRFRPLLPIGLLLAAPAFAAGHRVAPPVVPDWLSPAAGRGDAEARRGAVEVSFVVTDYGAVGDGQTDDTVAIQNTIDAAASGGGGTVVVPSGTYAISASLQMRSNVVLEGAGEASVIVADGDFVGIIYIGTPEAPISNTVLRDVTVRGSGNPADVSNTLVSMNRHVERAWMDRVVLDQAGYDAWHALRDTRQVWVTRCHVRGAGDDGLNPGGSDAGGPTRDVVLAHNHVSGAANDGIHVSVHTSGIHVTDNTIVDSGAGVGIFNTTAGSIRDNVIRNCGTGILTRGDGASRLTIEGNLIDSTTAGPGIRLSSLHDTIEIAGNTILDPAGGAAHGIEEAGGTGVTIRDNLVRGASDGIRVAAERATVIGNVVRDSVRGLVIDGSDAVVSGNNVLASRDWGILLLGGASQAGHLVTGNVVRDVTFQDGIRILSDDTTVTGNHVFRAASRSIADFGRDNTLVGNAVDGDVAATPTTRVIHVDPAGRVGLGTATPRQALDVMGDLRADALRIGTNRFRIFAAADGLYVEDLQTGAFHRIELAPAGPPAPVTAEGGGQRDDGRFAEIAPRPPGEAPN